MDRKAITFYYETKNYRVFDDTEYTTPVPINIKWHKAITQKLKELEWL